MTRATRVRRYIHLNENFSVWEDITRWCFENFGIPGHNQEEWYYNATDNWMDFYFHDPRSAELFILKWM